MLDEVWHQNQDVSAEELEAEVNGAVASLRQETPTVNGNA